MSKKQISSVALALWLTILSVFMLLAGRIDLGLFFILGFIGFLVIVLLMAPKFVHPGYVRYFWYLIAVGIAIFGAIVVQKVLEILGLEIVLI